MCDKLIKKLHHFSINHSVYQGLHNVTAPVLVPSQHHCQLCSSVVQNQRSTDDSARTSGLLDALSLCSTASPLMNRRWICCGSPGGALLYRICNIIFFCAVLNSIVLDSWLNLVFIMVHWCLCFDFICVFQMFLSSLLSFGVFLISSFVGFFIMVKLYLICSLLRDRSYKGKKI